MTKAPRDTGKQARAFYAWLTPVLLVLASFAHAHERSVMRFDRYSVAEGLAQNSVMAIAQDRTGFIWFATENGLDRFDGHAFTNYRHERGNPDSLAGDFARDLHVAVDGSLWIATDGSGLSRWDPATDRFTNYRHDPANANSIASDRIRTITSDAAGNIWIGTLSSGLDRLNPATGQVTHYVSDDRSPSTLSHDSVYAIAIGPGGSVWVGTKNGLDRLDPQSGSADKYTSRAVVPEGFPDSRVRSLLFDASGSLWVGTHSGGVARLDTDSLEYTRYVHDPANDHGLVSNRIETIFEDDAGRIWVGTDKGLSLWQSDSDAFLTFQNDATDPTSLSDNSIFSIYQDRGGVMWFGTRTGGISKWNPRSWSFGHFRPDSSEHGGFRSANISSFAEDSDGNTWIGTFGGGITVLNAANEFLRSYGTDSAQALSDDRVMALLAGQKNRVWAGTMTGGLNEIDLRSGKVTVYRYDPANTAGIGANGIMSLLEDREGNIWAGTFGGGVSRFDRRSRRFTNFRHDETDPSSLSSPRATSIAETGEGTIWVGTDGGGLNVFDADSQTWQSLRHHENNSESLSADTVYALHVDAADRLWVGTRGGLDLLVLSPSSESGYEVVGISNDIGLPRSAIYGIQSDSRGVLWLSTSHGLVSYDPSTAVVRNFHQAHGLQGEEFNFGAHFRSSDGRVFFGGSNGFNAFRPEELEFNAAPPPVALTSVTIMNEPVEATGTIEQLKSLSLEHSDDVVTFSVAALDFASPKNNRYAYRLVGFDDSWIDIGSERRITYTNLNGGDYTLEVRAANADGVWNDSGVSIPVSVAYPPWQTWWAYTLYALAVGFCIFAFWKSQQNKLKREYEYSRRLEREVHDRTRQLNERNKDLKQANDKLIEASTTDPLTGLRNRRFLFEQIRKDVDLVLRHYRDGSETLAPGGNNDLLFLMVDLDNFKPVNDSCGHEAGDVLLLQIRDVLLDCCRSSDDVIRWGGDEFLIIARETNRKHAAVLAERIRSSLAQRVFPLGNGQVARISSSIGYASYPFLKDQPELLSWEEVLGVADAAMYEAKQKRNAWTGIEGLGWNGSGEELCRRIKENPGELAEDGHILALESVEEADELLA